MPLLGPKLGQDIAQALNVPATPQILGWGNAIVAHMLIGKATFGAIPGPHVISGLAGPVLASQAAPLIGAPGVTPQILGKCNGIVTHIMTSGIVTYVGPPLAPPAEVIGFYLNGVITGLSGPGMANTIAPLMGTAVTPELIAVCNAITTHIMTSAQITFGVIT